MTKNKDKIIELIKDRIRAYAPERVYLFGSYARNEADDVSDIDLVVIKDTDEPPFDRMRSVVRILELDHSIDVLVYTPNEFEYMLKRGNAFAEMIQEEGLLIYDQETSTKQLTSEHI